MSAHAEDIDKRVRQYLFVGGSLLVLTGLTVGAFSLHLPKGLAIALALFIATVKASMVALVFMHLIDERKLIYSTLVVAAAFFLVLLLAPVLAAGDPVVETDVPLPAHVEAEQGDHGDEAHAEETEH